MIAVHRSPIICFFAVVLAGGFCRADVLHVSPAGTDQAPGTVEKPLALQAALNRAAADANITEIVISTGEYFGQFTLNAPQNAEATKIPRLILHPPEGETPIFHHSVQIDEAEAVPGFSGLYRTQRIPPSDPQMWERDTRVRYVTLSNKGSVAAISGSCFVDIEDKSLYFHTSDGKPPQEHKVFLALSPTNSRALGVYRPNTTIEGLSFRDYIGVNVPALQTYGDGITIRHCHFDNCHQAWVPWTDSKTAVMEECTGVDVAQGVYSFCHDAVVQGCRFEKTRDRFLFPLYPQNDCAYQVYFPGAGGTFVDNFCRGYFNGILIKAAKGKYILRHNTIVDAHNGVEWVTDNSDSDTSYNVLVNADEFINVSQFSPTFTSDYNLFWQPRQVGAFAERASVVRGANRGKFNLLGDPRFVDAENGDYRLLPDSPAVRLHDSEGRPAGAFGVALADAMSPAKPTLELAFSADTRPVGKTGVYTFDRDPWIGGGTTHVRDLEEEGAIPNRLASATDVAVHLRAFDASGQVIKTRVFVGDASPTEIEYDPTYQLRLPDRDGEHRVRFEVQNDRGVWSKPAEAILRLDRQPPRLVGKAIIFTNDNGLIATFQADEPCFAEVRFGATTNYGGIVQASNLIKRFWDANDGGEWVETWSIPRTEFALAILKPKVTTGQQVHVQIVLKDEAGLSFESPDYIVQVKGKVRTLTVSSQGKDQPGRGAQQVPFRTLQYAVDRALPGDRVILMPGVYAGYTSVTHGGLDEKSRLTIEAEQPNTVTLDSAKRENAVLHLESAPFVTLRNLRIVYFRKAGVYAYRSPYLQVDRCVLYNGVGWETGYHLFCFGSPHSTVTRTLAVGAEIGFYFLESPYATVMYNTYSQGMYAAAAYVFSLQGSIQTNNSFCFAGNDIYSGEWHHPDEIKTFHSDYNNLGTNVTEYNRSMEQEDPALWKKMKAEEFKTEYPYYFRAGSKAVVGMGQRYRSLRDWQEASGQDKHSIFADPKYIRPWGPIDTWDWRIKPDSPNIGAGEKGTTIGAFGAQ